MDISQERLERQLREITKQLERIADALTPQQQPVLTYWDNLAREMGVSSEGVQLGDDTAAAHPN